MLRLAGLLAVVLLAATGCGGDEPDDTTGAPGAPLVVGVVDDAVREPGRGGEVMEQLAEAGFRAVRVTSTWDPGETAPAADELAALRRV